VSAQVQADTVDDVHQATCNAKTLLVLRRMIEISDLYIPPVFWMISVCAC
jgi:hypothetical protein